VNSPLRSCSKNRDGFGVLLERLRAERSVDDRAGEGGASAGAPAEATAAVRYWQVVARGSRDDPWPRWMLAEALFESGDPEGARKAWRKALVIAPDFAEPALRLAQAEFHHGSDLEAVRWLKRIAGRRKTDDGLRVAILGLCLLEGESRHARAFAEAFREESPLSHRLGAALFQVFRLFDDVPRARQASGLSAEFHSRDPERLRLALQCA